MTIQRTFFTLLEDFLKKHPKTLDDEEKAQLIAYIKKHLSALKSTYDYELLISSSDGTPLRPHKLNFIMELIHRSFSHNGKCSQLSIGTDTLLDFLDNLSHEVNLTPFFNNILETRNTDLLSFLLILMERYHKNYYDRGESVWEFTLNSVKKVIAHLATRHQKSLSIKESHFLRAALFNIPELVGASLRTGLLVDCKSPEGFTPLCLAAQEGSLAAAKILVEAGANVNHSVGNEKGVTPVWIVVESAPCEDHPTDRRPFAELLVLLLKNGGDANRFVKFELQGDTYLNSWLRAVYSANMPLIDALIAHATARSGAKIPVNIHFTNELGHNAYLFALSDKTGRVLQRLVANQVALPAINNDDPGSNPVYVAIKDRVPETILHQILAIFSSQLPLMQVHPLVIYLQYMLLQKQKNTFLSLYKHFLQKGYPLSFDGLIAVCSIMVQQIEIDLSIELAILLRKLREDFFPTDQLQLALLQVLLEQFIGFEPANPVLRKEYNDIKKALQPSTAQQDPLQQQIAYLIIAIHKEIVEKSPVVHFFDTFSNYFIHRNMANFIQTWDTYFAIPAEKKRDNQQLNEHVHVLLYETEFVINAYATPHDEKNNLLVKYLLRFFQEMSAQQTLSDFHLGMAHRFLPFLRGQLFANRKLSELFLAITYDFEIEARHMPENQDRLFIRKVDSIYDCLVIAIKNKIGSDAFLIEKIERCLEELQQVSIRFQAMEQTTEIKWYVNEIVRRQLAMCWLLTQFNNLETTNLLAKKVNDLMSDSLLLRCKDDGDIQDYFLLILSALLKARQLTTNHFPYLLDFIGNDADTIRKFPQLNQWKKRLQVKERQAARAQQKEQYARQAAADIAEETPFSSKEEEVAPEPTINLEQLAQQTERQLNNIAINESQFWKGLMRQRNERYSPMVPWLKSAPPPAPAVLPEGNDVLATRELFAPELAAHHIPQKNHELKKLSYPDMDSEYWGVFAVDAKDCPRALAHLEGYGGMEGNFKKYQISKAGGGIHHDEGEFRIHPPGDWRLHASVYQKKDADGKNIVLLLFDKKFVKHNRYTLKGFFTQNGMRPTA